MVVEVTLIVVLVVDDFDVVVDEVEVLVVLCVVSLVVVDEVVVVDEDELQSSVPAGKDERLPPTMISSLGSSGFCRLPCTPHPVPYDFADATTVHVPDLNTCRAGASVTTGNEKMAGACSSDNA